MKWKCFFLSLLVISGCTEKEIVVEPDPQGLNQPPGDFIVRISNIKDTRAEVSWTHAVDPDSNAVSYDVAIGDSVIASDFSSPYLIENLQPDSLYSVSVIAYDSQRNENIKTIAFRTTKSYIQEIINYDLGYADFRFLNAVETADGGLFIFGMEMSSNLYFYLKLDSGYKVEWLKERNVVSEPNALMESSVREYYILFHDFVLKLDKNGNEIWEFTYPADYHAYLKELTEAADGNLIIVGNSSSDQGSDILSKQYFISKLSPDKIEIWSRFGNPVSITDAGPVIVEENGNITFSGSAGTATTIFFLDQEGQFIRRYVYMSNYNGTEIGNKFLQKHEDDYLLFGSISEYDGWDFRPRFLRIDGSGNIIWDKYHYLFPAGSFQTIQDIDEIGNDAYLVLSFSPNYGGINIASIMLDGEIGFNYTLPDLPIGPLIKFDKNGDYVLVSSRGQIIIFNHDGNFPE